jgi:type II secretory pathway component PulJ
MKENGKDYGYTLIETIIALFVMAMIVLPIVSYMRVQSRSHVQNKRLAERQYDFVQVFDLMTSEIRTAGYVDWQNVPDVIHRIDRAEKHLISFQADLDEDGSIDNEEHVTYRYVPEEKRLLRSEAGGEEILLLENVEDLTFSYLDNTGSELSYDELDEAAELQNRDRVRIVRIEFSFSGNDYPTLRFRTAIYLRNTFYDSRS